MIRGAKPGVRGHRERLHVALAVHWAEPDGPELRGDIVRRFLELRAPGFPAFHARGCQIFDVSQIVLRINVRRSNSKRRQCDQQSKRCERYQSAHGFSSKSAM